MAAAKGNKNAIGNKGGGRKTDFQKAYAKQAYKLALLGATDKDLADFFEVSERTINTWKKTHFEFLSALKKGKNVADAEIAVKLYQRATGYKYDEVSYEKIVLDENNADNIKSALYKKKVVAKEVAPDVTAQIFWLKNRQSGKWKDKHHQALEFENMTDQQLDFVLNELKKSAKN